MDNVLRIDAVVRWEFARSAGSKDVGEDSVDHCVLVDGQPGQHHLHRREQQRLCVGSNARLHVGLNDFIHHLHRGSQVPLEVLASQEGVRLQHGQQPVELEGEQRILRDPVRCKQHLKHMQLVGQRQTNRPELLLQRRRKILSFCEA